MKCAGIKAFLAAVSAKNNKYFSLTRLYLGAAPFLCFLSYKGFLQQEFDCSAASMTQRTPALSYDQDFKKGRKKWSMYSGPILHTDTGKYCQNLKTLGKSDI